MSVMRVLQVLCQHERFRRRPAGAAGNDAGARHPCRVCIHCIFDKGLFLPAPALPPRRRRPERFVPFISWLKGPLAQLVEVVKAERHLFDGKSLERLDIEQQYPILWSLMNWLLVSEQVENRSGDIASSEPPDGAWGRPGHAVI